MSPEFLMFIGGMLVIAILGGLIILTLWGGKTANPSASQSENFLSQAYETKDYSSSSSATEETDLEQQQGYEFPQKTPHFDLNDAFIDVLDRAIEQMPKLPGQALQLTQVLLSDNFNWSQVKNYLESQPDIAARVLRTVNSAAFGLSVKQTELEPALSLLGVERLYQLVMSEAMASKTSEMMRDDFFRYYWLHAAMVSNIAAELARSFAHDDVGKAATVGLLHDIGKTFLTYTCFVQPTMRVNESRAVLLKRPIHTSRRSSQETDFLLLEEEFWGLNHCVAGAFLADRWEMSEATVDVIRYHHYCDYVPTLDRVQPSSQRIVALIALADKIAAGYGSESVRQHALPPAIIDTLGTTKQKVPEFMTSKMDDLVLKTRRFTGELMSNLLARSA